MNSGSEPTRVVSKLEELDWFEAVAANSVSMLTNVPEEEKSTWYKKYQSAKDDQRSQA